MWSIQSPWNCRTAGLCFVPRIRCAVGQAIRLLSATRLWYECRMVKAYIGIANSHGLQSFLSEGENAALVITSDSKDGRVCRRAYYWAAVSDDAAMQIREYLRVGDRHQALLTLDTLATDIAPLGQLGRHYCRVA